MKKLLFTIMCLSALGPAQADTVVLDLPQIMERAMSTDQRITEKEKLTDAARALLQEAQGSKDWIFNLNAKIGRAHV